MKSTNRRFAQKIIAVIVIVTMLYGAGVAPVLMMFVTGVVFLVFLITRRAQNREVERLFDFFVTADSILREEERRWYRFEVSEVIESGELVLEGIPDPPPLHLFALGALHHKIGNFATSVDYLSHLVENEHFEESSRETASPQLRRYVYLLRKIEKEPAIAPQTLGAIRSLERMRRRQAFTLLTESRNALKLGAGSEQHTATDVKQSPYEQGLVAAPPPISDLLKDIYQDDQSPSN
ncbi:MAG TPA: hypothetical protein VLE19_15120 [Pyrinomonadaceae bacterium]|nr:hypothetical protein [Pyrinomonadaceae bacterium]